MRLRGRGAEALLLLLLLPAAAAADAWRLAVRGMDATRQASFRETHGLLLVDVAALAPTLGLAVRVSQGEVTLRDPDGRSWRAVTGESRLTAPGEEILLEAPLRLEGRSAYLPVSAVAELAGLSLFIDSAARRVELLAPRAGEAGDGWQPLELSRPLTPEIPGEVDRGPAPSSAVLPPDRESLRLVASLGHVLGADWGGELTAAGSVRGWDTRMFGLLTQGAVGLELAEGHVALTHPDTGRGGEAGNLFSEIRGSAQGARLIWSRGRGEERSWPALSLYLADEREEQEAVLAYRDELTFGDHAGLGGEIASDGSWLLRGRWQRDRLGLFGYWRDDDRGGGRGLSAALDLPRGAGAQAAWSRGGAGAETLDQLTWSLRVPLLRGSELGLEGAGLESGAGRARSQAVLLGTLLGPVRLRARWQRRWSEGRALPGRWPVRNEQDELRATATLAAGPRLAFELQSASRWAGEESDPWQQLAVSWRPLERTTLQIWAVSSRAPLDDPLRARLTQDLPRGFSLLAEYGRLPSFQSDGEEWSDGSRFKLLVRRTWEVGTPAGGGVIEGRVASPLGPPPPGTPVELGPYRALTAADGRYAFRHVPRGEYEARVPEDALPSAWSAPPPRRVDVQAGERAAIDLELIPLGHVRGRVWEDRDGDGQAAPGEGVAGVVVRLADRATRTEPDGSFGFFNLPPGSYRLEIDPERLPSGFTLAAPSRIDLGLPPGSSLDGLALRLARRHRPVIFQEIS